MDDFWEFVNHVNDNFRYLPIPRMILRDVQNPLERYTNEELLQRYRFGYNSIQLVLLPLVYPDGDQRQQRGLPVPIIIKLCSALRFFATGSYQV
ncbi:hypothetical protein RN001_005821 [Aquatica leii]|uniref:Uncharacterized protein n=1 Tax=Aquatica leii TaxID=1421715 RepID=A0AAN7Q1T9_9COLE|nr:hypothetical protein RN001_005821 [Aquatica leii]